MMGLFDTMKKSREIAKNAEWKKGVNNTLVELHDNHIKLITPTITDTIFYKDIVNVEQNYNTVVISTPAKTYKVVSRKLRGGSDRAAVLCQSILEQVMEYK